MRRRRAYSSKQGEQRNNMRQREVFQGETAIPIRHRSQGRAAGAAFAGRIRKGSLGMFLSKRDNGVSLVSRTRID